MMKSSAPASRPIRGISLIEMLVGLTVGLVLVSIALLAWAQHVRETRRLLLETRLMQELRTTADLMARNLRRAGHWANAPAGVWQGDQRPALSNPHAPIAVATDKVLFSHSPPGATGDESTEPPGQLGYRLRHGVVEMQMSTGPWQAMTDAGSVVVTGLSLSADVLSEPLGNLCARACLAGTADTCPPRQEVKRISLRIEATSAHDASVKRRLQSTVRLRNDTLRGSCPP